MDDPRDKRGPEEANRQAGDQAERRESQNPGEKGASTQTHLTNVCDGVPLTGKPAQHTDQ